MPDGQPFATAGLDATPLVPTPNTIVHGNAAEDLGPVPDESVHLVVTSPPYWNLVDYGFASQIGRSSYGQFLDDLLAVWRECERVLVPNGKLCIDLPIVPVPKALTPGCHTRELKNLANDVEHTILANLRLRRFGLFVWQKQTTEKMFGSYPYPPNIYENNTVEFVNIYVKPGRPRRLARAVKEASRLSQDEWIDLTRQVWWIYPEDVQRTGGHPAPFPLLLPLRLIRMFTFGAAPAEGFAGDLVLDPFCGSGTTCAAAKVLGRRYLGIDGSAEYVSFARTRVDRTRENRAADIRLHRLSDGDRVLG